MPPLLETVLVSTAGTGFLFSRRVVRAYVRAAPGFHLVFWWLGAVVAWGLLRVLLGAEIRAINSLWSTWVGGLLLGLVYLLFLAPLLALVGTVIWVGAHITRTVGDGGPSRGA
jgi:hypothetical protein